MSFLHALWVVRYRQTLLVMTGRSEREVHRESELEGILKERVDSGRGVGTRVR